MFRKVRLCFLCICSIIICVLIFFSIDQYSRANFNQELMRNLHNTISITREPSSSQRKDADEVFPEQQNRVHDTVIIPDFEILVMVSPDHNQFSSLDVGDNIYCLFQNNSTSPAKSTGVLPSSGSKIFKCSIPENLRDLKSIHPPILTTSPEDYSLSSSSDESLEKKEVFRCLHPTETEILGLGDEKIRVSLQVKDWVVPSVAYYTPPARNLVFPEKKLLCASTMVYNVSKFLREWVIYHSKLGIDKFIFYDNGSEDGLQNVVDGLRGDYNVDIEKIGQVEIFCYEFGPSNQKVHPVEGVTQGYTCRRRILNRHESIVLLDAIDTSLYNVIHHFELKDGFHVRKMSSRDAAVNHYKYQAWSEFQAKFKRRVSAYVADWTDPVNPMSKDRTPGLGFEPVEPKDWGTRFCEVEDTGLKMLTQKWFGLVSSEGHKMVWQDA
ncbi:glycosyltransferase family 92 protein Os08g0121900-like isoform X2 [Papaver somniferum]|uniref:glycosyltransferase family 92 protein Os08g0121900-like isoform X2 n=1 Tax=Papaver somniferum TaxID=3469 RepID=UPI000E6FF9D7|nr:glycosyltransferase family 92 protein Os08g0121900-like isoform X2 [Papaver somniferum]